MSHVAKLLRISTHRLRLRIAVLAALTAVTARGSQTLPNVQPTGMWEGQMLLSGNWRSWRRNSATAVLLT